MKLNLLLTMLALLLITSCVSTPEPKRKVNIITDSDGSKIIEVSECHTASINIGMDNNGGLSAGIDNDDCNFTDKIPEANIEIDFSDDFFDPNKPVESSFKSDEERKAFDAKYFDR